MKKILQKSTKINIIEFYNKIFEKLLIIVQIKNKIKVLFENEIRK